MTGCVLRHRAGLASMGGTYQAIIVVLTRAVESPRLEPHLACGDAAGNEPATAIAKKPDFEHWLSLLCASILPHREPTPADRNRLLRHGFGSNAEEDRPA